METFYTYDPQRRRLQNLAVTSSAGTIMDNAYRYDAVSNVLSIANAAPLPQSGKAGGQMSHTYGYDALYRLTSASGTYRGADNKSASYTLAMSYDNMHRIKSKSQHLTQQGVQFDGTLNAGYDLTYTYQDSLGHKFQLSKIEDLNYRTEGTPNEKIDNGHRYLYDANGNLVYINTGRVKKDGKEDEQAVEKKYRWDEENRLLASDENGFVANYWYDADGERTVKSSGEGEQIYVNSEFSAGVTNTAKFSLYVSPYLVASQGGKYTKHIYIGSQRIVSKLGDLASYGADPRRIPYAGTETDGVSVDYQTKYNRQQQAIKDNYADFGAPYNGEDTNDYVNGQGFSCNDVAETSAARAKAARAIDGNLTLLNLGGTRQSSSKLALPSLAQGFKPNDDYEKMQFYYNPDQLGISSYITNLDGEVVQHIEYVPFGEVFIEERNNTWNTPYLFNAMEYDKETGMYYYGARYYEPRISLWMSVDPISIYDPRNSENYLDGEHNDGVYNYRNLNPYIYCYQSPISLVDPNGKQAVPGAILGSFTEYAAKIGDKMLFEGMDFKQANSSLTRYDFLDITVAAGVGAVSGVAKFSKFVASPIGKKIINLITEIGLSSIEAGLKSIYGEDFSLEAVLVEVGMGEVLGKLLPNKIFKESADRAKGEMRRAKELMGRKSATPKVMKKQGKVLKEAQSEIRLNESLEKGSEGTKQIVSKVAGNKTQKETRE
uniref:RHS repeat domain-containing protein n=1 Tax=Prevotella sp. TaxID=59823 RepID=UPI003FEF0591